MNRNEPSSLIAAGLSAFERRVYAPLLEELCRGFRSWLEPKLPGNGAPGEAEWLDFLKHRIRTELQGLEELRQHSVQFDRSLKATREPKDQRQVMLNFARDLGATPAELKADEAAFARWFGPDALRDRYVRRHARHEQQLAFLLGRLGAVAATVGRRLANIEEQTAFWNSLKLESVVKPLLVHDGDPRLNLAAFRCLATVLSIIGPETQERVLEVSTLQYVYRSALRHQQQVWLQCAAFELLVTISWTAFERALQQRLLKPGPGDDLFVRRRAVELLARNFQRVQCGAWLVPALLNDPSPFVRQAVPKVIVQAPPASAVPWLEHLVLKDPAPEVRAAACLELRGLLLQPSWREDALRLLRLLARDEKNEFVLRVICLVSEQSTAELARCQDPFMERWEPESRQLLLALRCGAASLKVRRWASQALELIWSECRPELRTLRDRLTAFVRSVRRGRSRRLPRDLAADLDPAVLGRLWSVVCRRDYDVQLVHTWRGYKVIRGHVFGFRWWRWWFELRHPSPDKRQAFPHTIGRVFDGEVHVPSAIMAELAQTKVPGEPLQISEEGGWRPYLPLVDELTSAIELGRRPQRFRIITSEGVTRIEPPNGWQRWRAACKLTWQFRRYADKRNWLESSQDPPSTYVRDLRELGFRLDFEGHRAPDGTTLPVDPSVQRFFPVSGMLLGVPLVDIWDRFQDYFVSLYQNSVPELLVFSVSFAALFFGLHLWFNRRLRRWRRRIPLVVGGWGTRGKSGTERLKAALFNALGLGVVSKTTGCEAMFLQAYPFGPMKEMFLFRPYDKATIWEQVNVVRIAGRLRTDVMLWECMGLTPGYVKILQRSWMRDHISTITNTYPDHEDLQGPAGIDIPEVIGCFIPENSTVVTTEEQMLPILSSEAACCKTKVSPVTWLEAGLIPSDILKRFPYEEHPYNIALVLGLAEQLGIERDFALKEMADRVVPDLGVLKTFPVATIRTRRLDFTNGMSANERFGTISNWTRTGFDRQDYIREPDVWLTTVVNNRADRVPRSQVFARVLVNDLSADRHVLIGGNLNGLLGYIREAWGEKAPQLSLWKDPRNPDPADALKILEQQAVQMRLPYRPELLQIHLRIMLAAQPEVADPDGLLIYWDQPDALKRQLAQLKLGEIETAILNSQQYDLRIYREYETFADEVRKGRPEQAAALDQRFRELLQQWFQSKIIVVEDYFASGNQIIETIARHTPPGFLNRVMGIQNIKGTGLDFVYRWQAWQVCYNAAQPLRSDNVVVMPENIAPLAAFEDYGVLCAEYVRDTVARIKNSGVQQSPRMLEELDRILQRLDAAMEQIQQKMNSGGAKRAGWLSTVILRLEEFLDAGDAVRRRSRADRIYEDLIAERISRDRAVAELQALTQRQKGGWLLQKLSSSTH